MTTLQPMRAENYPAFFEESSAGYAQENVASGRWPAAGALQRARADLTALLPDGLATPDQLLFDILDGDGATRVGYVWINIERRHGAVSAYIYDIEIKPEHRRRGHAFEALRASESIAIAAGATAIGLNVFVSNAGAQALYRKLGYVPTNINMSKPLTP